MTELRKAAEQALEALETLDVGDSYKTHNAASALRRALAHPEQETFTLDRGCYERGCVAYDERDGDGVTIKQEKEWVDLTDEDIQEIFDKWDGGNLWDGWNYEYAIVAKVKEKNT